jgi:hypothetical protein
MDTAFVEKADVNDKRGPTSTMTDDDDDEEEEEEEVDDEADAVDDAAAFGCNKKRRCGGWRVEDREVSGERSNERGNRNG